MKDYKLAALELVLTFLTMFGPATRESLAAVYVLFEAILGYDYEKEKFDEGTAKVCEVADHLIAMADLYGVECNRKQLEAPGGRRAILRVMLGPVLDKIGVEGLERIRNDAVEAMMFLTFKPLSEVQDVINEWANQATKDGRYQARVCSWTGFPIEDEASSGEVGELTGLKSPTTGVATITTAANPCSPGPEIAFTFLKMIGVVTKESVAATEVLFEAVLGYSEATGKFDKDTVKKVPNVSEHLCSLTRLYGIRCEPRMLNTPPGARAMLREFVGPIIEGHSPEELEEIRKDAADVAMVMSWESLEEVEMMMTAWAAVARDANTYQARASTWTGKPMELFDHGDFAKATRSHPSNVENSGRNDGENASAADECQSLDGEPEESVKASLALEIATSSTVIKLDDVSDSSGRFPGQAFAWRSTTSDAASDTPEKPASHIEATRDLDELDVATVLMDASDEGAYDRLAGFRFPAFSPPTPLLDVSLEVPRILRHSGVQHSNVLMEAIEQEVQAEERKAVFGPYADAWEDGQLSGWSTALQKNDERCLPGVCAGSVSVEENGVEILEATDLVHGDDGTTLLKMIQRILGFA